MPARQLAAIAIALAILLAIACGGRGADSIGTSSTNSVREAQCRYLGRCHPHALEMFPGGTVESCAAAVPCWAQDQATVEDPRACSAWLASAPCTNELHGGFVGNPPPLIPIPPRGDSPCAYWSPEVERALQDAGALGEPCIAGEFACVPGLACVVETPLVQAGNRFCGTCEPPIPAGQACSERIPCDPYSRCVDGDCKVAAAEGAPCTSDDDCLNTFCTEGLCGGPPAPFDGELAGTPCDEGDLAACGQDPTLACIDARCVPRRDQGEACEDANDCRYSLTCRATRCAPYLCDLAVGESCASDACAADLACDPTANTCEELPNEGEPCSFLCAEGLYCSSALALSAPSSDGTCRLKRENGTPCEEDAVCASNLCQRDIRPFCSAESSNVSCAIAPCETPDCGVCAAQPGRDACE